MTDDLDDNEMDPSDATTVHWTWRGVNYEFDTRSATLAAIEKGERAVTVADLLSVSRKSAPASRTARPTAIEPAVIRDWARRHGHTVPTRGRIPRPIRMAYDLAQA
ncbi:MAG: Lsr2 family protein [Williamsia herbipolensis]|nr:Lsr2 family protein [Williamsia herbipolensis]